MGNLGIKTPATHESIHEYLKPIEFYKNSQENNILHFIVTIAIFQLVLTSNPQSFNFSRRKKWKNL